MLFRSGVKVCDEWLSFPVTIGVGVKSVRGFGFVDSSGDSRFVVLGFGEWLEGEQVVVVVGRCRSSGRRSGHDFRAAKAKRWKRVDCIGVF